MSTPYTARQLLNLVSEMLTTHNRPLRLVLDQPNSNSHEALLPQRVMGHESICGGLELRVLCLSTNARLSLKDFIGVPAELQVVTDRGQLRRHCGIITSAESGQSDGGLATYQLVIRDALAVMEQRLNTRVFLGMSELDVIQLLIKEWQIRHPALASTFDIMITVGLDGKLAPREFIMQHNQSDAAFIRYLMQRRGIAWFIQPGLPHQPEPIGVPKRKGIGHTLVLFDDPYRLLENRAGRVRFHRDDATEERDAITYWGAQRQLQPGRLALYSWDYKNPNGSAFNSTVSESRNDQGEQGNPLASLLEVYVVESPHLGVHAGDLTDLGHNHMAHFEYAAKSFHGEGSVRDLACGEWFTFEGHPEIDTHEGPQRQFVVTEQWFLSHNNLPADITDRIQRLFSHNGWDGDEWKAFTDDDGRPIRYKTRFSCVRRGIRIAPSRPHIPRPAVQSAIVVGPAGEEAWCDQLGRIKIRFPATRAEDHAHAYGAGTLNTDGDSAWVRLALNWAGGQLGARTLPRAGSEVMVDWVGGDPDKPIIVGQVYNAIAPPPPFAEEDSLPATRYQSGMRSREIEGNRGNQLRLDDTTGQISAQLASDHASTELNLGFLTEYRRGRSAAPRGEGAELRTDEAIALHAARGIFLSAWQLLGGVANKGSQLSRDDFLGLLRECGELFASLGDYAAEHNGLPIDPEEQSKLLERFANWDDGSNMKPEAAVPREPVIGITAPRGIGFASSKAIVSYSAKNIDTIAQQHLQLTSGQRVNINAGKGISLFSRSDGLSAIAHFGKLVLQSQHDDTVMESAKNIQVTANDGTVTISAKKLHLIVEDGSFIRMGNGEFVLGSKKPIQFHAPDYLFDGPDSMTPLRASFAEASADQKLELRYPPAAHVEDAEQALGGIVKNAKMHVAVSDGTSLKTRSDADGKSDLLQRDAMHLVDVQLLRGGEDQ